MVQVERGRDGKGRDHECKADEHLDVVSNHEEVEDRLETLGFDGMLGRALVVLHVEAAVAGEEEDPDGEAERDEGLGGEGNNDLETASAVFGETAARRGEGAHSNASDIGHGLSHALAVHVGRIMLSSHGVTACQASVAARRVGREKEVSSKQSAETILWMS